MDNEVQQSTIWVIMRVSQKHHIIHFQWHRTFASQQIHMFLTCGWLFTVLFTSTPNMRSSKLLAWPVGPGCNALHDSLPSEKQLVLLRHLLHLLLISLRSQNFLSLIGEVPFRTFILSYPINVLQAVENNNDNSNSDSGHSSVMKTNHIHLKNRVVLMILTSGLLLRANSSGSSIDGGIKAESIEVRLGRKFRKVSAGTRYMYIMNSFVVICG